MSRISKRHKGTVRVGFGFRHTALNHDEAQDYRDPNFISPRPPETARLPERNLTRERLLLLNTDQPDVITTQREPSAFQTLCDTYRLQTLALVTLDKLRKYCTKEENCRQIHSICAALMTARVTMTDEILLTMMKTPPSAMSDLSIRAEMLVVLPGWVAILRSSQDPHAEEKIQQAVKNLCDKHFALKHIERLLEILQKEKELLFVSTIPVEANTHYSESLAGLMKKLDDIQSKQKKVGAVLRRGSYESLQLRADVAAHPEEIRAQAKRHSQELRRLSLSVSDEIDALKAEQERVTKEAQLIGVRRSNMQIFLTMLLGNPALTDLAGIVDSLDRKKLLDVSVWLYLRDLKPKQYKFFLEQLVSVENTAQLKDLMIHATELQAAPVAKLLTAPASPTLSSKKGSSFFGRGLSKTGSRYTVSETGSTKELPRPCGFFPGIPSVHSFGKNPKGRNRRAPVATMMDVEELPTFLVEAPSRGRY